MDSGVRVHGNSLGPFTIFTFWLKADYGWEVVMVVVFLGTCLKYLLYRSHS